MAEFNLSSRKPLLRSQSNAIPIGLSRGFVCSLNQIPKGRFREAAAASLDPLNLTRTKAQAFYSNPQEEAKLQESRHIQNLTAWHQLFSKLCYSGENPI